MFSLDGRVALVTGSSRGLGFAMAKALAENGALVVINGRDQAAVEAGNEALKAAGPRRRPASTSGFLCTRSADIGAASLANFPRLLSSGGEPRFSVALLSWAR